MKISPVPESPITGSSSLNNDWRNWFVEIREKTSRILNAYLPSKSGVATLVSGSVSVLNKAVTSTSMIRLSAQDMSGVPGELSITNRSPGVGFMIVSTSGSDSRKVFYEILEAI